MQQESQCQSERNDISISGKTSYDIWLRDMAYKENTRKKNGGGCNEDAEMDVWSDERGQDQK